MLNYKEYYDDFNARLTFRLREVLGNVDLEFLSYRKDRPEPCTVNVTDPKTGIKIRIRAVGNGILLPLKRVAIQLDSDLPGGIGSMRRELRTSGDSDEISIDRIVSYCAEISDRVGPLYRLRRAVKDLVWPVFGLDPREVEDCRKCRYGERDLRILIQWGTRWRDGKDQCCVMVKLGEPLRSSSAYDRSIEWLYSVDDAIDMDQFRQRLQKKIQEWDQEDREDQEIRARRDQNGQVEQEIRNHYRDLNEVSLDSNSDGFRVTVSLKTEQEVRAMLEWCRIRQQPTEKNGPDHPIYKERLP